MDWSAIGAIGEVLGALAVLASLIYLARQIRQNTRMMKSTVRQQLAAVSQQTVFKFAEHADILAKVASGDVLTPVEDIRARLVATATFRGWETYAYQHKQGLLDPSEWRGFRESMRAVLAFPIAHETWLSRRHEFSDILRETVDPLVADEPPGDALPDTSRHTRSETRGGTRW
jgi:hypothetical protein